MADLQVSAWDGRQAVGFVGIGREWAIAGSFEGGAVGEPSGEGDRNATILY